MTIFSNHGMLSYTASLILLFLLASCQGDLLQPDLEPAEEVAVNSESTGEVTEMLRLVNNLRRSGCNCGGTWQPAVPALQINQQLTLAARRHATDMRRMNSMQHAGSNGSNVGTRATAAGYSWRGVAENIAWGYSSVSDVVTGWKNSPGHCRNLMSADYVDMGGARDGEFWAQVFAR